MRSYLLIAIGAACTLSLVSAFAGDWCVAIGLGVVAFFITLTLD